MEPKTTKSNFNVAVLANDIQMLKDQHGEIKDRIDGLEQRVGELEVTDMKLSSDIAHHIKSEDERWDRNEAKWDKAFKLHYFLITLVVFISLEHIATVKDLLKIFF